jgi:catechol 2,3-dioxygenase-like lactoylglutathione lyase family enzyme
MKIAVTSILVNDQDKALRFYTDVLGLVKKADIPMGEHAGSPSSPPTSPREPSSCSSRTSTPPPSPSSKRWSKTAFRSPPLPSMTSRGSSSDCAIGVQFTQEPAEMGPVTTAVFDDTCGNLIQIASRS